MRLKIFLKRFQSYHLIEAAILTEHFLSPHLLYNVLHDLKREIFWKKIGGHRSFLWDYCHPYFGLPMTCALGFKARVDTSLSHFSAYIQRIPQIHLWGITPDDLLTASIAAEPSLFHILFQALVEH